MTKIDTVMEQIASTENFFKFLFLSGLTLLVFGFVYPIERSQELELRKTDYAAEVELVNYQIEKLRERLDSLKYYENSYMKSKADSLYDPLKLKEIGDKFDKNYSLLYSRNEVIDIKTIEVNAQKAKILVLQNHIDEFNDWQYWLVRIGGLAAVIGGLVWAIITLKNNFKKP